MLVPIRRQSLRRVAACAFAALGIGPLASSQECGDSHVGVRPLDDLRTHTYLGLEGGLYPGGSNAIPAAHADAGRSVAARVVPLDASGAPSPIGTIGVVSLGFSLTRQMFRGFLQLAAADASISSSVTFVNAAMPGQFVEDLAEPDSAYWTMLVPQALDDAGLDARQIEVVWLMDGDRDRELPFPDQVYALRDSFISIVQTVKGNFPNAKLCYLSSLPYMGYLVSSPAVEPYYFEQGFAQRLLIEDQIDGDPDLEWDGDSGPVVAPWLAWGPYLWCDGDLPRSDGFTWTCDDVEADGTHPSAEGEAKVGGLLLHFWKSDPTATPWFLESGAGASGHPADVELVGDGTPGSLGEPLISVSRLPTVPTDTSVDLQGVNVVANGSGLFLFGYDLLPNGGLPFANGTIYVDYQIMLPVAFDAGGAGRYSFGALPDDEDLRNLVVYAQLVTFDHRAPAGRFALSSAITIVLGD